MRSYHGSSRPAPAWLAQALPIARDLLLIGAVVFYVFGFTYETAKSRGFGAPVAELANASVASLALAALRFGMLPYAALASLAPALVFLAVYITRAFAGRPFCAPLAYAIGGLGIAIAVFGSSWLAWRIAMGPA